MNKNSFPKSNVLKSNVALFLIIAMLIGFFVSRAVLSMATLFLGVSALIGVHPKEWFRKKWWLVGLLWIGLYLLSYFWSGDYDYWYTRCEVKMPILLLPLAFAFIPAFSYKQIKLVTIVLISLLLFGTAYSLSFLIRDPDFYIKGYGYSHVLPTFPKNDHIVFSLALACSVVWNVYFFPHARELWLKWLVGLSAVVFAIMLHILAARTGLVALYVFIICYGIYLAFRKGSRLIGVLTLALFLIAGVVSVKYVPTLRNRMAHFNYTVEMFRQGNMSGDYSDIGRYMSYIIAARIIKEHPLVGVGAGDILEGMKSGYDRWYPNVPEEQRLIPHNQFLTVGVACGIPAMLFFVVWVIYPLFLIKRNRSGFFVFAIWLTLLIPILVEPLLEIQFGVFVYLFFLLWQVHSMNNPVLEQPGRNE